MHLGPGAFGGQLTHQHPGLELHPFGLQLRHAALDVRFFELEVGDAVAQQAAHALVFLVHRDRVPGARDAARRGELAFGTVDSFLLWRLTGGRVHATDATNAGRTMLFDIHAGRWDEGLCDLFGVPPAMLPEVRGLKGPLGCLTEARFGIVWGVTGAARDALAAALDYSTSRTQFGQPIGGFQLTQKKLADMAVALQQAQLTARRIGELKDGGRVEPHHISFGKFANVSSALGICREARSILGGSGITTEYPVLRHANNLESVLTYEGTSEMHALVVGQALTGLSAFRG